MKVIVLSSFTESLVNIRGPLLCGMRRAGHRVVACAPDNDPEAINTLKQWGLDFRIVPLQRTGMSLFRDLRFLIEFSCLLVREQPEVFLAYQIKPVTYGLLASRFARVPRSYALIAGLGYAFTPGDAKQRAINWISRRLYRLALPRAHKVFFQNPDDLNLFIELGLVQNRAQAVLVNGSGVDLDIFQEAPAPDGDIVFLLVARLLRDKGIAEYVEAARGLKYHHPKARFQIFGRFDDHPTAIKPEQMEAWRREGAIEFLGAPKVVQSFLRAASVFVLPSYREGTPRSVLEAMAVGRPVVTTNVPGCRETVVEGENGFLVPVRDSRALANAMERFILKPELVAKMGQRSRQLAVEKFDVNKVNALLLETMGLAQAPAAPSLAS